MTSLIFLPYSVARGVDLAGNRMTRGKFELLKTDELITYFSANGLTGGEGKKNLGQTKDHWLWLTWIDQGGS